MSANLENSAVATGWKRSIFIPFPTKSNAKECSMTVQLSSFHILARLCSESFKPGFSSKRTENFQCTSWVLKRQRNQRSNCQHPLDHGKSKRVPEKHLFLLDYAKAFDCVDQNKLWKILKEMGIPDHLACLLRNLYAGQEATVRTGHGTTDWLKIRKKIRQGCILSSCLFNFYADTS